jgi:hypothetical protein
MFNSTIIPSFVHIQEREIMVIAGNIEPVLTKVREDNAIPLGYDYPRKSAKPHEVKSSSDLGGLLRHYYVDEAA